MKKKGFTLVELLAVIVILAVLALIAIPVVNSLIKKSREGALKDSAYGLIDSANYYYANQMLKDNINQAEFDFVEGLQTGTNGAKLDYKGEIKNGKLIVSEGGKIAVCIDNGTNYAYKSVDEKEVTLGEGTCSYDGTTGNFEILSTVATLNKELKEQKEKYEKEINDLKSVGGDTIADNILSGQVVLVNGVETTGTMANNGEFDWKPTSGTTYTLPAGYYSGGTLDSSAAYNAGLAAGSSGQSASYSHLTTSGANGNNDGVYQTASYTVSTPGYYIGVCAYGGQGTGCSASGLTSYGCGSGSWSGTCLFGAYKTAGSSISVTGHYSQAWGSGSVAVSLYKLN